MLTLRPLQNFERGRVWDQFLNDTVSHLLDGGERGVPGRSWAPAVDIYETANELVFNADLPGFERDQIDISVEEGHLSITAERKLEQEQTENTYQRRERFHGKFHRSFRLPPFADAAEVSANLKDGVLTVRVPKREEARPRQIPVEG